MLAGKHSGKKTGCGKLEEVTEIYYIVIPAVSLLASPAWLLLVSLLAITLLVALLLVITLLAVLFLAVKLLAVLL